MSARSGRNAPLCDCVAESPAFPGRRRFHRRLRGSNYRRHRIAGLFCANDWQPIRFVERPLKNRALCCRYAQEFVPASWLPGRKMLQGHQKVNFWRPTRLFHLRLSLVWDVNPCRGICDTSRVSRCRVSAVGNSLQSARSDRVVYKYGTHHCTRTLSERVGMTSSRNVTNIHSAPPK
jgi:hypothetical protein